MKKITTILQVCINIILSVSERNFRRGIATRREHIPFETGDEMREPRIIQWEKVRSVEDGNSDEKDGTAAVELQSHEKIRAG